MTTSSSAATIALNNVAQEQILTSMIHFDEVDFDFVILDEAQAIKNAATETAKAVRLLKADNVLH